VTERPIGGQPVHGGLCYRCYNQSDKGSDKGCYI